jgi:hypothetical protein
MDHFNECKIRGYLSEDNRRRILRNHVYGDHEDLITRVEMDEDKYNHIIDEKIECEEYLKYLLDDLEAEYNVSFIKRWKWK